MCRIIQRTFSAVKIFGWKMSFLNVRFWRQQKSVASKVASSNLANGQRHFMPNFVRKRFLCPSFFPVFVHIERASNYAFYFYKNLCFLLNIMICYFHLFLHPKYDERAILKSLAWNDSRFGPHPSDFLFQQLLSVFIFLLFVRRSASINLSNLCLIFSLYVCVFLLVSSSFVFTINVRVYIYSFMIWRLILSIFACLFLRSSFPFQAPKFFHLSHHIIKKVVDRVSTTTATPLGWKIVPK